MHRPTLIRKSSPLPLLLLALSILPFLPWINSFFYYDDGVLLNLAQLTAARHWQQIIGFGFNGHFRPLPVLTAAAVYQIFGARSPIPFHLIAILLHALNVQLMYRLLLILAPRALRLAAFFAAAIFSVHWAGSEAVTYFAAIGILWSMLGGLIAALSAVQCLTSPTPSPWIAFNIGLILSFAGGEYAAAALPFIAATALIIYLRRTRTRPTPALIALALNTVLWLALYVAFEISHQRAGRLGTDYSVGTHILVNLNIDVARTSFPTAWIDEAVSPFILAPLCLAMIIYKILRPRALPLFFVTALLFATGIVSSLPFAPSQMGSYPRFVYFGAAFWALAQLFLCLIFARTRRGVSAILIAAASLLLVANLIQLQVRMKHLSPILAAVRQTVAETENVLHDSPRAQIWFMNPDLQAVRDLLITRNTASPLQVHSTAPPPGTPTDQPQILIWSTWQPPYFTTTILRPPPAASLPAPG